MQHLPFYIPAVFIATTLLTFFFIAKAFNFSKKAILIIAAWLLLQAIVASSGFYNHLTAMPPRILLAIVPPFGIIAILLSTTSGRRIIDTLPADVLTLLHVVRIPVEIVLYWLFMHKTIPGIMTFEGRNFDILSGVTAPVVYYYGFVQKKMRSRYIIVWNMICLALLFNIVITAILSAPFPFQQFAFDQPNIAVLYAPYIWLPCFIVPVVLFSHITVIRQIKITGGKI